MLSLLLALPSLHLPSLHLPSLHLPSRLLASPRPPSRAGPVRLEESEPPSPLARLQTSYQLFQEGNTAGGFKQGIAEAIAGEYDRSSVESEVKALAASAPLVLFTWETSPSCKKALKLLEITGAKPKIVRLDDPWSEGNPRRAALGRLTGKPSVPSIWIGGSYVGGCEDGPSDEAPGLVTLAFRGTLYKMLEDAGAFSS